MRKYKRLLEGEKHVFNIRLEEAKKLRYEKY
jgi:hypothetical protein